MSSCCGVYPVQLNNLSMVGSFLTFYAFFCVRALLDESGIVLNIHDSAMEYVCIQVSQACISRKRKEKTHLVICAN